MKMDRGVESSVLPRRLKVAYVVSMTTGLHSFVYREIQELRERDVSVILLPTKVGSGPYLPPHDWLIAKATVFRLVAAHCRTITSNARRYLSALREAIGMGAVIDFVLAGFFSEVCRMQGVQLIHCHFGDHKLFIGYFCGKLANLPVSVTVHAYELYSNPNPPLFRRALSNASAIVTIAEYNRSVLVREWGVPSERVLVIPLFAIVPPFAERPEKEPQRVVLLTVARLVEKKGHKTLLEALSLLPPNYEVWVVGTGPLDVKSLARRLGLEHRVRLFGRVSDKELESIYGRADIFCLPSETTKEGDREGIPVVLMEAMAHGLPVVATRHAGIPELVREVLVSEGDPRELAHALAVLGGSESLREEQGRRNREIVSSRFSRENVLLLKSVFERLAS